MSPTHILVNAAVGLLAGVLFGLTGAGGSVLTLPALIALAGLAPQEAVAASLLSVGLTAAASTLVHARRGHVELAPAAAFALTGALAALLAGRLGRLLPDAVLMCAFATLMVVVATRMLRRQAPPSEGRASRRRVVLTGGLVGSLSGVLGIGGGFLVVPALAGPLRMPMHKAIGTGLAIVSLNAGAGLAGTLGSFEPRTILPALPFVAASLVGGPLGGRLAARWSVPRLRLAFALLVLGVAAALLVVYGPRLVAPPG